MLTPPGYTETIARDHQQQLLADAESLRLRPHRPAWPARVIRKAVTSISAIIA